MHTYPYRASLEGLEDKIFKLVAYCATRRQWAEWLRVPLEHAAAHGNLDMVNMLLGAGANGGARWTGFRGRSLLNAAALGGNADVLTALIRAGAGQTVNEVLACDTRSALYTATFCGYEDVARVLIRAGANVNYQDWEGEFGVLHEAAGAGHEQLVQDLLVSGANIGTPTADGCTPLHWAAREGRDSIVSALLIRGADKDATDKSGTSPLMLAASKDHFGVVNTLLTAGADFNIRSSDGDNNSALDLAAGKGNICVLKKILDHGADVNARDDQGATATHRAAENNQACTIDALIEVGADIEVKTNTSGRTPLRDAALGDNRDAMLTLLRHGAAVNTRDDGGYTILHFFCDLRPPCVEEIVSLLLRWGADETIPSVDGRLPVDSIDLPPSEHFAQCPQDALERVRTLLARAPVDRTWRRRCWLVMLRSRASRAWSAAPHTGGEELTGAAGPGDDEDEGCEALIAEDARKIEGDALGQQANNRTLDVVSAKDGGSQDFGGVVTLLVDLSLEEIFRTVVTFL